MAAGDSSHLRRMPEPPLECRRVAHGAKAVPDRVLRQIDIHVPFEVALFEPIQNVHCRFIERQRDLVRKVPIYLEQNVHGVIENKPRTRVNTTRAGRALPGGIPDVVAAREIAPDNVPPAFLSNESWLLPGSDSRFKKR
jgi:hypothetical protein